MHPQGIAQDGQSVKLLQLESLPGGDGMGVRSEEGLVGPGQAGPNSASRTEKPHTPLLKAKSKGKALLGGSPPPPLCQPLRLLVFVLALP